MKTSNVDPNLAPQGSAQLSANVAVDFRIASQKLTNNKESNARMQFMQQNTEESASDFGVMQIQNRMHYNMSHQNRLDVAAYRNAMR